MNEAQERVVCAIESIAIHLQSVAQSLCDLKAQNEREAQAKGKPKGGQARIVSVGTASYTRPNEVNSQVPGFDRRGGLKSQTAQRKAEEKFRRPHSGPQ